MIEKHFSEVGGETEGEGARMGGRDGKRKGGRDRGRDGDRVRVGRMKVERGTEGVTK